MRNVAHFAHSKKHEWPCVWGVLPPSSGINIKTNELMCAEGSCRIKFIYKRWIKS